MLLFFISPLCTTESLDAEDAPDHLPRPPAQQGKQEETAKNPQARPSEVVCGMIMTSLLVECRETREELVHRKPDRHS